MAKKKKVEVTTFGRTDLGDFFEQHIGLDDGIWNKTPFLVFDVDGNGVTVVVESRTSDVLEYPDETKVMKQWAGEWSSNFFQFTVGELRKHHDKGTDEVRQIFVNAEKIVVSLGAGGKVKHITPSNGCDYDLQWEIAQEANPEVIIVDQDKWGKSGSAIMPYSAWRSGRRY